MLPILARWVVEQQRLHSLQQPQHHQQQHRHLQQDHRQHPREEYHRQEQWWQEQEEDAKLENLFSGLDIQREGDNSALEGAHFRHFQSVVEREKMGGERDNAAGWM